MEHSQNLIKKSSEVFKKENTSKIRTQGLMISAGKSLKDAQKQD